MKSLRDRLHEELGDMTGKGYAAFIKANFGDLRTEIAKELAEEWIEKRVAERRKINTERKASIRNYESQVYAQRAGLELLAKLGGTYEYIEHGSFVVRLAFKDTQRETLYEALRLAFMNYVDTWRVYDLSRETRNSIYSYLGATHMIEEEPNEDEIVPDEYYQTIVAEEIGVIVPTVDLNLPVSELSVNIVAVEPVTIEQYEACFNRVQVSLIYEGYQINLYDCRSIIQSNTACCHFYISSLNISGDGYNSLKQAYRTACRKIWEADSKRIVTGVQSERDYYPDSLVKASTQLTTY